MGVLSLFLWYHHWDRLHSEDKLCISWDKRIQFDQYAFYRSFDQMISKWLSPSDHYWFQLELLSAFSSPSLEFCWHFPRAYCTPSSRISSQCRLTIIFPFFFLLWILANKTSGCVYTFFFFYYFFLSNTFLLYTHSRKFTFLFINLC